MTTTDYESGNAVLQTIHSSEGGRAFKLLEQRKKRAKEIETAKNELEENTAKRKFHDIDSRYQGSSNDALEEQFKAETVGLVSAAEFREKRAKLNELLEERARKAASDKQGAVVSRKFTNVSRTKLSFGCGEDDEEDECGEAQHAIATGNTKLETQKAQSGNESDAPETESRDNPENEATKEEATSPPSSSSPPSANDQTQPAQLNSRLVGRGKHLGKDPSGKTHFLPDPEREEMIRRERERLTHAYYEEQQLVKQEILEVTYSYWDGSGHRRTVQVAKGSTIGEFLTECRKALEKEFTELRSIPTENLMYIKEDLILPQNVTFYDLIRTKARGKSGPLFHFDVHEDVRMMNDARVEKDESHAGKIVDRKWYDRNKHIFPASRWSVYDPSVTYEKYTIHGHDDFSASQFD